MTVTMCLVVDPIIYGYLGCALDHCGMRVSVAPDESAISRTEFLFLFMMFTRITRFVLDAERMMSSAQRDTVPGCFLLECNVL